MSDVLLAGLSDPEAAAVEIMIGRRWPMLHSYKLRRLPRLGIPEQGDIARGCSSCIVDLFSFGLRVHNEETEAKLLSFLEGRPALLILRGEEDAWSQAEMIASKAQPIRVIRAPYSSAQLLGELVHLLEADGRLREPLGSSLPRSSQRNGAMLSGVALGVGRPENPQTAVTPAWQRALELAEQIKKHSNGAAPVTGLAAVGGLRRVPGVDLRGGALRELTDVFPGLRTREIVTLVERLLVVEEAMLLQFNRDVGFVGSITQGWLASGIAYPILLKTLAASDTLHQMDIRPVSIAEAEESLRTRFGSIERRLQHPLDTLTWDLAAMRLTDFLYQPKSNLVFQLRRFPNFPRLIAVGALDFQLAALCARAPQSISGLATRFPDHHQDICRFATLAIISGLAWVVSPSFAGAQSSAIGVHGAGMRSDAETVARRGFFKSLLDKLF